MGVGRTGTVRTKLHPLGRMFLETLTFDLSTHERAYRCAALLRAQGFTAHTADGVVKVEVEAATSRWAVALVRAMEPGATPL
jgi:hypothetical protein